MILFVDKGRWFCFQQSQMVMKENNENAADLETPIGNKKSHGQRQPMAVDHRKTSLHQWVMSKKNKDSERERQTGRERKTNVTESPDSRHHIITSRYKRRVFWVEKEWKSRAIGKAIESRWEFKLQRRQANDAKTIESQFNKKILGIPNIKLVLMTNVYNVVYLFPGLFQRFMILISNVNDSNNNDDFFGQAFVTKRTW